MKWPKFTRRPLHWLSRQSSSSTTKGIPFQILSDLHLEINQQYTVFEIPIAAKYLILAGDIGRLADYDGYRTFLHRQTQRFELVFLVLGNHEFYNESFETGLEKARQLEQEPYFDGKLVLLHRRRFDLVVGDEGQDPDGPFPRIITILGCTLWSHVPDEARDIVQAKIQDYHKIQDWTVDTHNAAHETDLTWVQDEIPALDHDGTEVDGDMDTSTNGKTRRKERTILVVTHHAPSLQGTSSPQHENNPWKFAFGTDLLASDTAQKQWWDRVRVWVFGHTHFTTAFKVRDTDVVSNQRGYVLPWTREKKGGSADGFDVRKVVWV